MKDVLSGPVAQLNGRVTLWLARVATVALAAIAFVTFCDVVARRLFNSGFTFTVEFTELSMALIVFLGVGLVTHQRGHIVVDVVTLRMSDYVRIWLGLIANILSLGYVVIMVWRMWGQAAFVFSKGDMTPIWNIPLWPFGLVISIGGLFLITGLVLFTLDAVDRVRHPERGPIGEASSAFKD
jgi:TRAP-type C4-dicarboxylate transport system permease small subunit